MLRRNVESSLRAALADTPVVLIVGARQVGKSTLVHQLIESGYPAAYVTLDDLTVLDAARSDPAGFLAGFTGNVAIDEIQRAPGLLLAIKASVDRDRTPGRFILTGSANVLALPRTSDALVGRMEVRRLRPLSQGELQGVKEDFVDRCFAPVPAFSAISIARRHLVARIVAGGYPEAVARSPARRAAWFDAYVTTIVQRDVRDLARIEDLTAVPRILALLASRTANLLNVSDIARSLGIPLTTVQRYLALLESIFLVEPLAAWSSNLSRRLARAPKAMLDDTGLAAHLRGSDGASLDRAPDQLGPLLETFIAGELRRQLGWSITAARLLHFRDHAGSEVDVVMEDRAGRIVGVEVKGSSSVSSADARGLRSLATLLGERFVRGIVLYTGDTVVPLGDRLFAVPVSDLWSAS